MFSLRVKLITQGEKQETSTKTCNETTLRDKLRVFVSPISPPLSLIETQRRLSMIMSRQGSHENLNGNNHKSRYIVYIILFYSETAVFVLG